MLRFDTPEEASDHLAPLIDRPVPVTRAELAPGVLFRAEPVGLGAAFTNSYTVSWDVPAAAEIVVTEPAAADGEFARRTGSVATTTGGFFFLADRCRHRPRTLSLNLAVGEGRLLSLPVATQEALVSRAGALSVVEVPARGELSLAGRVLRWAGSRTRYTADCYAYGNANCVIAHRADERTGRIRVLREDSRFTPEITDGAWSDLGFLSAPEGGSVFEVVARRDAGRLDIFAHDLVLRCPRAVARRAGTGARLEVRTIGPLEMGGPVQGAVSAGPSLFCPDPYAHPLNDDRSLGSFPLLRERPSARLVFFATSDGRRHLRLFDGRPGSRTFPGVTLAQAVSLATADGADGAAVTSGCLLDSGHTSRITVLREGRYESFGNRHYLRWPTPADPHFTWDPGHGRPVASLIALR